MNVKRIVITDYKGVGSVEILPGALTILSGPNGCGKSSVIDAIKDVFDGGHRPSNIRNGAKRASIEIEFDNGAAIQKVITPKGTTLKVTDESGQEVKSPQKYVSSLADGISFDPLSLLAKKPKDRIGFLLGVWPLSFTAEDILDACPFTGKADPRRAAIAEYFSRIMTEPVNVERLDALRGGIYDERTRHNVIAKDAAATASNLRKALPSGVAGRGPDTDWASEVQHLESEINQIAEDLTEKSVEAERVHHERVDALREERDEKIRSIRQDYEVMIQADKDALVSAQWEISNGAKDTLEALREKLGAAKQSLADAWKVNAIKDQIASVEAKARENSTAADKLSLALDAIEAAKRKKMESIPIPGLTIQDGEIYIDGVTFDQVNTARKYVVAWELASLAAGPLGLMVADESEALVGKTWTEFSEAAAASGLQLILARASGDSEEMQIEAIP